MFFMRHMKRKSIVDKIKTVLESTYEIKHNHKITFKGKQHKTMMYFPSAEVAVEFNHETAKIKELESTPVYVFVAYEDDDPLITISRLLFVINRRLAEKRNE